MNRGRAFRRFLHEPVAVAAGVILAAVFTLGAIFPWIAPTAPGAIDISNRWRDHAPTLTGWHVWGTNNIGQDILVRTLWGLHTSEKTAFVATALALVLGGAVGGAAGYFGGWSDAALMRITDVFAVFPAMIVLLAATLYLFPLTIWKTALIFGFYLWVYVAKVMRSEMTTLRKREFVEAAVAGGASNRRIFFRHLLPHANGSLIVATTAVLGQVLILEATIEFFGVGIPSSQTPTLGNLIGDAEAAGVSLSAGWWTWVGPAVVLTLVLVCASLLGDGIAEALRVTGGRRRRFRA